jgi:hypothetical protein
MGYKVICDMCEEDVDDATGIIEKREFVHVHGGRKICMNVGLSILDDGEMEKPSLCLECLEKAISDAFEEVRGLDGYA